MQVALITPVQYRMSLNTGYHMILPHLLELEDYRNYFKRVQGFKILDNGANENIEMPIEDLIMLGRAMVVDEIIIPDVLGNKVATQHKIEDFLLHPATQLWNNKLMAVVQGKTWDECYECLDFYLAEPRITTIGLPRLLAGVLESQMARVTLARYISERKPVHCLGAHSWIEEVTQLAIEGNVRGIDTSYPFVMAKALKRVSASKIPNEYIDRGSHIKYFTETLNNEQWHFMASNAQEYLKLVGK
jgi:hypothetical protein